MDCSFGAGEKPMLSTERLVCAAGYSYSCSSLESVHIKYCHAATLSH